MKYQLGLYEKSMPNELSFAEKFAETRMAGFDHLEISIDETDEKLARLDWTAQQRMALLKDMDQAGVRLRSMCLSGHRKYPFGSRDVQLRNRALEIMEKAIQLAEDLGIRIIQLAGYDVYYEEGAEDTEKLFSENLQIAVEKAASHGILLGFETMETPFMDTVEKAMKYVNQMDSPYLGVYPDIGNLKNASLLYGKSVNDDLAIGKGHIFAAHLKETVPGKYREIPFGTGHTEFSSQLKLLKDFRVNLFVGEFWHTGSEQWREDLAFANSFLRKRIDDIY